MLGVVGGLLLIAAVLFVLRVPVVPVIGVAAALAIGLTIAIHAHTSWRGKFQVWDGILRGLPLGGDERLLDIGCGRGAVLLAAARSLPRGEAVGIDIWSTSDQSGNSAAATMRNAAAEGVTKNVRVLSADMRKLPFADGTFDVVVSSMAIHNLNSSDDRSLSLDEGVRVLRDGGTLAIVDFMVVGDYAAHLRDRGLQDVQMKPLGWRFWYGSPWLGASLVKATKGG